jgi:hypothetical protein
MCASRVSTCMPGVFYRDLDVDVEEHQESSVYALYESLLTYVAHLDLVGDPFKVPATRAHPRYSLLKFVRYST